MHTRKFIGAPPLNLPPPPAPPSWSQAALDLTNQVQLPIQAGDVYLNASPPEYSAAVSAYQAAGQAGATSVGPEIDGLGAPAITQPSTQLAWQNNGTLQTISAAGATLASATTAQSLAKTNLGLYQQAIAAGQSVNSKTGSSLNNALGWALGLGSVVGVYYAMSRHPRRRR